MNIKKTIYRFSFVLVALVFSSISAAVTVTGSGSTFEINIGEGFDDADGADREAVFVAAAKFWADILVSPVVIEIDAEFSSTLTCTSNSGTLGSAGPASSFLFANTANLIGLQSNVFYPTALINAYNGSDRFPNNADISARFNARLGDSDCLSARSWYYGLDGNTPSNQIDFFDIVRHELGHGLGILSLANDDGTDGSRVDIFTTFLHDQSTGKNWTDMTDAERNVSVTNNGNVVWTGAEVTALAGDLTSGVNSGRVQIYSPNPVEGGSSTSHFDSALTPNELMEPDYNSSSTSEHSIALLKDIGWSIFSGNTNSATNNVPVISGQSTLSTNEDTSLTLSLADLMVSDSDNNFPTGFSLSVNSGNNYSVSGQTITPSSNYFGVLSVPVTVNDGTDSSDSFNVSITVNAVNDNPTISGSAATSVNEGSSYSFTPTVSDVDSGDTHTFTITNQPSWATFNQSTGTLTGTLNNSDVGVYSNIVITVTDSAGATDNLSAFSITVFNVNNSPVLSGSPSTTVAEGNSYSYTPSVTDIDVGDTKSFSISNKPSWATFSSSTGALTGTPNNSDVGVSLNIVIAVTDSAGATASLTPFNITVLNVNDAPIITGSPTTVVDEDNSYSFIPSVNDVDADDSITFSISNKPNWANFSTLTGALTGIPSNSDVGTHSSILITATDHAGAVDNLTAFSITVTNINDAPIISGSPFTSVVINSLYNFTPTVSDVDVDDSITFSISNIPSWANFSTLTGVLTGTPINNDVGTYSNIIISATDSAGATDSLPAFSISIINDNNIPVIMGSPETIVAEGSSYSFTPTVSDADVDDTTTFSISNKPNWAVFSTLTGTLTGTPENDDVGSYLNIVITAADSAGAKDSLAAFSIEVLNVNNSPVISGSPNTTVAEGNSYSFTPLVNDIDIGDPITFSISNIPNWAAFNTLTGALTGTPTSDDVDVYSSIIITATDSIGASDSLPAFSITVTNVNNTPVVSDQISTVDEDSTVTIILSSDASENDQLSYAIVTAPSNGTLVQSSNDTWVYSPEENYNGNDSFTFKAISNELSSVNATVNITVNPINDAPVAQNDFINLTYTESGSYELNVLNNDSDIDGDNLTIVNVSSVNIGTVNINDNKLIYLVDELITEDIELTYTISDGVVNSESSTATVTIRFTNNEETLLPVITLPDDIEIDATGLFTKVDLGVATGINNNGDQIPVTLVDSTTQFVPGSHVIEWQAEDNNGLTQVANQRVDIFPLITIAQDRQGIEGETYKVGVYLNGESPSYPVNVEYTVSGSADENDHNLVAGVLTIDSGLVGYIEFTTFQNENTEANENIIITLENTVNLGAKSEFIFTITENNIAPQVSLSVSQSNEQRTIIDKTLGDVVITSELIDDNVDDNHTYLWESLGTQLIDIDDNNTSFTFNPENITSGQQIITLTVTDDANMPLSSKAFAYIDIVEVLPDLTSNDQDGDSIPDNIEGYGDSDGDGIADYLDDIDRCNIQPQIIGEYSQFYIETEAGYCVSKGINTLNNESGSLLLDGNEITADESAINVGGIFDFVLTELPIAGDSVSIVIPQRLPIPENALYRKVNSNGVWTDFTIDENNYYSSTAGEMGFCPSPSDERWTTGLTEGHWCVQLTIEDGGSNDDDGLANHQIVDPGGVFVLTTDNTLPIVEGDAITVSQNTSVTIDVLANDTDNDGDNLSILTASVDFGTVTIIEQQLHYQPDENFSGVATINYSVSDGNGGTGQANVLVTVVAAMATTNTAPIANNDSSSTNDTTTITIDVLANDTDSDNDDLTLTQATAEQGSVIINNNRLTYIPFVGFEGIDTVIYSISDNNGGESQGQVTITITASETTEEPTIIEPTTNDGESSGGDFGMFMLFLSIAILFARITLITRKNASINANEPDND